MASFTDRKGRVWNVDLDLRIARQIDKSDFSSYYDRPFSILNPESHLLQKLLRDGPFLFAIIWAMVQEQAQDKYAEHIRLLDAGVKPERTFPVSPIEDPEAAEVEFVSGVNGPTIEAGRAAMVEAIADFFPDLKIALSTIINQSKRLSETVGRKLQETEPMLQELLEQQFNKEVEKVKQELLKT